MIRTLLPMLGLLAAAACAGPPVPSATLPQDAVVGAGDPTRAAILGSAYVFGTPGSVAGRPDLGARAAAQVEHLAVEIPNGPRWVAFSPQVSLELVKARREMRSALGIAPQAPPQKVVDSLYAASRAWAAGDPPAAERALARDTFSDPSRTLVTLANLPPLPRTQFATVYAQFEMERVDRLGDRQGGGGGDGGKN